MSLKRLGIGAALVAAACGLALGGAAIADAATGSNTPSAPANGTGPEGGRGASADTPVTGDQAAKVIAAVKAKDSAASITSVRKDPDGSYDALGTKSGTPVMYDVSADLKTITQNTGGGGHGGGAPASGSMSSSATPSA